MASKPVTQSGGAFSSKGNQSHLQTTETAKEPVAKFSQVGQRSTVQLQSWGLF